MDDGLLWEAIQDIFQTLLYTHIKLPLMHYCLSLTIKHFARTLSNSCANYHIPSPSHKQ